MLASISANLLSKMINSHLQILFGVTLKEKSITIKEGSVSFFGQSSQFILQVQNSKNPPHRHLAKLKAHPLDHPLVTCLVPWDLG